MAKKFKGTHMNKIGYPKVGQPLKAGLQTSAMNSKAVPSTQAKMPAVKAGFPSKAAAFKSPKGMNKVSWSGRK